MKTRIGFWAAVLALVVGCKDRERNELPPVDSAPTIRRISPPAPSQLALPGTPISLTFQLADNERLARFTVEEKTLTNVRYYDDQIVVNGVTRDTVLLTGDVLSQSLIVDKEISGNSVRESVKYVVPNLPPMTRIELNFCVEDNKGQKDCSLFVVTVDFKRTDTLAQYFSMLSYRNDTLYNRMAGGNLGAFNLIARQHASSLAAQDIRETTETSGEFDQSIVSPNNQFGAVMVVVRENEFNYDQASYSTMRQAYLSRVKVQRTPKLRVGDIVLLQLTELNLKYNNWNHFAAIKVKEVVTTQFDDFDYIVFDYKRSQDND